jgi:hypothetical protein
MLSMYTVHDKQCLLNILFADDEEKQVFRTLDFFSGLLQPFVQLHYINLMFLMFMVPYILVTICLIQGPTRSTFLCILYSSLFLALHVSGAICTHSQEHNCSVQP